MPMSVGDVELPRNTHRCLASQHRLKRDSVMICSRVFDLEPFKLPEELGEGDSSVVPLAKHSPDHLVLDLLNLVQIALGGDAP